MNILQAMKDALNSLEAYDDSVLEGGGEIHCQEEIGNLLAAIEEIEKAKPVAWRIKQFNEDGEMCGWIYHQIRNEGQPIYTHPAPTIPEGWQLVPKEPTDEMNNTGQLATESWWAHMGNRNVHIYKAMLAAAPEYKP